MPRSKYSPSYQFGGVGYEYRFPKAQQTHSAATFSMALMGFERLINEATKGFMDARIRSAGPIVNEELDKLIQLVVKPQFQAWAPQSPKSTSHPYYKFATGRQALKKSIQKWTLKGQMAVGLRMNWYGYITMEGRGGLRRRSRGEGPYPIILPDGTVRFTQTVGPATVWGNAEQRMAWAQDAYYDSGIILRGMEETARNIAYRIWQEAAIFALDEGGNVRDSRRMDETGRPHYPEARSREMKQAGVRSYRTLNRDSLRYGSGGLRGRPKRVRTLAQKRALAKQERERKAATAKSRKEKKRLEFSGTGKTKQYQEAAKHAAKVASPATQVKKARAGASKARALSAKDRMEHFNRLREDYQKLSSRLTEMEHHGTYTEKNLLKQRTRVKRAEQKLADFMRKSKE